MESKFAIAEEKNLNPTPKTIEYIKEIAKWAKFFAVIGYFIIAFMVFIAIIIGLLLPKLNSGLAELQNFPIAQNSLVLALTYIILAILYIYPVISLHQFANKTNKAIQETDKNLLEEGFKKLKQHFTFVGRMTIVILVLNVLLLFVAIIGGFIGGFLSAL